MSNKTSAQQVADQLGGDGSVWTAPDGRSFDDVITAAGAQVEYSEREHIDESERGAYDDPYRYIRGSLGSYISGDPVRYVLADGSAIVAIGDGWDIEGRSPFSWAMGESGDDGRVTLDGREIDIDAARALMDDELCDEIHGLVDTDQEFLDAYLAKHEAKYGSPFVVS